MEIPANVLAKMRQKSSPDISGVQKEISNFVARNGGKMRPNFWVAFNAAYSLAHDVMVCVGADKKVSVLPVRRDKIFAHHIGVLLKSSKIMWGATEVNWSNWEKVYSYLVPATDVQQYDSELSEREENRLRTKQKKLAEFYDLAKPDRYKKIGKRGFNTTFDEIRAVQRQERYERRLYGTFKEAKRIMENI